ncbi:MAG: hypothetical protein KAT00_04980 [Planctomycetes bacterium]|nr:hypothetical protein [Planctomycetota bacterium]
MRYRETGHTLAELIIVVLFIGVLAAIAVPRLNFSAITKQKAETVAKKIVTDMRRTRSLAISDAAVNTTGYALRMDGTPPYTQYRIRNRDTATVVDIHEIPSDINVTGGATFRFGPLGNLVDGSDTTLTVAGDSRSYTITLIQATGTVKCVQN